MERMTANMGFIALHRKILDWEWYDHLPTKILFIHCLLKANFKDKAWRGIKIKRGQFITSLSNLSKETGLSVKQVRVALENLQKTNEVDKQSTRQNTVITVLSYDEYQKEGKQNGKPNANAWQTGVKEGATTNNANNVNNENKERDSSPPDFLEFQNYADEKGSELNLEIDESKLKAKFLAWKENGWKTGKGTKIKNWKSTLLNTLNYLQKEKYFAKKEKPKSRLEEFTRVEIN